MNRIIPIVALLAETRDEQPVGRNHHLRVARFHRKNERVVIEVARDAGKLERALHHPERGVAVAVHDPVAERAVVGSDAHRNAAFAAQPDERSEPLANPLQLRRILLIGVFDDFELLGVGVVARIDPDLLDPLRGFERGLRFEMDVRDDRHIAAARAQSR